MSTPVGVFQPCSALRPGGPADFQPFCRQHRMVDIIRTAKLRLTSLSIVFYASSRWAKGMVMAKMRPLPADPLVADAVLEALREANAGWRALSKLAPVVAGLALAVLILL